MAGVDNSGSDVFIFTCDKGDGFSVVFTALAVTLSRLAGEYLLPVLQCFY
ncbi:hypothetical protein AALB_0819 [Agarivorans albus MKT 106]|uniref:Uncharacterized protein n=1 Tax=Agarivorans albus MKT 106 TaxID=1331007 RepID=R9PH73_AGAAL|nr:hypothetical protein AALB_0819 [Agarivorans albus MKT 106]